MWLWGFYGSRTDEKTTDEGYIECAICKTRQPSKSVRLEKTDTIYGFAIGRPQLLGQWIECSTCLTRFPVDQFLQSGTINRFEPKTWHCPRCEASNASNVYQCSHCGYSLV